MLSFLRAVLLVSASGLGVTVSLQNAAYAQSADSDVVVVTGTRTETLRQQSTQAVSVLTAQEIERLGAQHISEALNRLPGVNLNRGNGAEHLTAIRSPVLTGSQGAGSFLYLEDGVPLRAAGFANINGLGAGSSVELRCRCQGQLAVWKPTQ